MQSTIAATPKKMVRDRFITAIRGFTIMILPIVHSSNFFFTSSGTSVLGIDDFFNNPYLSWYLIFTMPCMFFAGGAVGLRAARGPAGAFVKRRIGRLMIPYWVFGVLITVLQIAANRAGLPACTPLEPQNFIPLVYPIPTDCLNMMGPFWYLAIFIVITLSAPLLARLYDKRHMHIGLPILLLGAVAFFDLVQKATGTTGPIYVLAFLPRMMCGWSFFFVLGFLYKDKYYERPVVKRWLPWVALVFAVVSVALITIVGYPKQLTGGLENGNQFPPKLPYLTGGIAMLAIFLWIKHTIIRLTSHGRSGRVFDWVEDHSYTIYIWHMVPIYALYWVMRWAGALDYVTFASLGETVTVLKWVPLWLDRLFWPVAAWLLLIPLVKLLAPIERWDLPPRWWKRRREAGRSAALAGRTPSTSEAGAGSR